MSITPQWNFASQDRDAIASLVERSKLPWLAVHLLHRRGVRTPSEMEDFLNPCGGALTDPFALSDMREAVERITRARDHGEKVLVYGDYDADGVTSTALLVRALRRFGLENCSWYVPNRIRDGYGLNVAAIEGAKRDGITLVITVDNGIMANEAADEAQRLGVDLIITDHHALGQELPRACAVINPKRDDPNSPFRDACGAAVAFKLACALTKETHDLSLVALATVADVVPLKGENRTLVARGLSEMASDSLPGLEALARSAKLKPGEILAESIAFQMGPRLNAPGRLGDANASVNLLLSSSIEEAESLAKQIEAINVQRREVDAAIFEDAEEAFQRQLEDGRRSIVLANRGWNPGVIGIVASKIHGRCGLPVVLIAIDDEGIGRGSARSAYGFNLVEALSGCAPYLEKFGGHENAAGMTVLEGNVDTFSDAFEAEAERWFSAGGPSRTLEIDAPLAFTEIGGNLLRTIDRLEPFGQDNPSPVFSTHGVRIVPDSYRELRGGHVRCTVTHDGEEFTAIGFGLVEQFSELALDAPFDIAYTPKFNSWRGETTIQLELKDVRP
ncbi:MAG: single-stranded-DNA-specific exonuclease RecJ [Candidatus Hydrogenedentes bacterium]|nr:single-stranded-DNA-specific exonuclease RecJ [Candidatus Hydrogenedentota bacterium]